MKFTKKIKNKSHKKTRYYRGKGGQKLRNLKKEKSLSPGRNVSFEATQEVNPVLTTNSTTKSPPKNKDLTMCKIVSDSYDNFNILGKPKFPPSIFNIEQNDNSDFDKISEFLYKISPAAIKKKQKINKGSKI
jgi:hypothetical protein